MNKQRRRPPPGQHLRLLRFLQLRNEQRVRKHKIHKYVLEAGKRFITFLEDAFANIKCHARCCGNTERQRTNKPDDEPEAHAHTHKEEAPKVEENTGEEEDVDGGRGSRRGFPTTAPQKKSKPKKAQEEKATTRHNVIKSPCLFF